MEINKENETKVERKSELELVVTRTINAPVHIVFEAWTQPELFQRWWMAAGLRNNVRFLRA